jgi:DNA-directed RNA polymerase specialized sigma24 family protein
MDGMEHAQRVTEDSAMAAEEDPSMFEPFFAQHQGDLFAAMWLVTRDRQQAKEIAQDSFLRLCPRWDRVAAMDIPRVTCIAPR